MRHTKKLLTHGTTIQRRLSSIKHSNSKRFIEFIWEKRQTAASTDGSTFNGTGLLEQFEQPEKTPVPDVINILAENNYGTFTATEHSSILRISIDVTNAQCNCEECFQTFDSNGTSQQNTFKCIDEDTVLF